MTRPNNMTTRELLYSYGQVVEMMRNAAIRQIASGAMTKQEADAKLARILTRVEAARVQLLLSCVDGGRQSKWSDDESTDSIAFESAHTTDIWLVNQDVCECPAYEAGKFCWHRAAAHIIRDFWKQRQTLEQQAAASAFTTIRPVPRPRSMAERQKDVDEIY